jgi:hypothetical protein
VKTDVILTGRSSIANRRRFRQFVAVRGFEETKVKGVKPCGTDLHHQLKYYEEYSFQDLENCYITY